MTIKFNPSSAIKWWTCAGSARLESHFKEETLGYHAEEGIVAHKLAEKCLRGNEEPELHVGKRLIDELKMKASGEMAESVQKYMEYVWKYRTQYSRLSLERSLTYTLRNGVTISGICDALITESDEYPSEHDQINIIDFKFGKHKVAITKNKQMYMYALMVKRELKTDLDITVHICQPRIDHYPKISLSSEDLDSFERELEIKVHSCFNPNPEYVVGDHCTYCSAKKQCSAYRKHRRKSLWGLK